MSERACSNPLCSHFRLIVPEGLDHFRWALQEKAPLIPSLDEVELTTEYPVRRLGRKMWEWIVTQEDHYGSCPRGCVAKIIWFYSWEKDREVCTERYYFCEDCNEVLEKANA